jgi:CBS domain-containing protein
MKVHELMTTPAETCPIDTDLATAAMIMWWRDCGAVPITDAQGGRVVGMITDRDICMATATKHVAPDQIRVSDVMNGRLHSVTPDDEIETALERMASARVRRLPVVDAQGEAVGMLSLNDLVLRADPARARATSGAPADGVLRALKSISEHRPVAVAS